MTRPLAIDLFCGLGGWSEGLLAEGYQVIGFDIERHEYLVPEVVPGDEDGRKGTKPLAKRGWTQGCAVSLKLEGRTAQPRTRLLRYPSDLVIQDVLTLHGSQFRDATLIVASPPCQEYSYMAMPWSKAKLLAADYREGRREVRQLTALFDACFRIQREACTAAGRHIPMIVENVRGAIPWVGRSRWNFGSFHLWGDVPALMPITFKAQNGSWRSFQSASVKTVGHPHIRNGHPHTKRLTNPGEHEGMKHHGSGAVWFDTGAAALGSKSSGRKMASAMIAKIPLPLARHIARSYLPADANGSTKEQAAALVAPGLLTEA